MLWRLYPQIMRLRLLAVFNHAELPRSCISIAIEHENADPLSLK